MDGNNTDLSLGSIFYLLNGKRRREKMKTNYEARRREEARKIIDIIASYADKNAKRTKKKKKVYLNILEACQRDLKRYGVESD